MFKKRIVFCLLFLTGIFLVIFPLVSKETSPKTSSKENVKTEVKTVAAIPTPSSSPTLAPLTQAKILVPTPTPQPTPMSAVLPTVTPTATPTPVPAVQTMQVNLVINGGGNLTINVDPGNNQCDVLSKASEQGKISSLNMRYDNNLGTNAVYQINGIGKENSVWWTYKVNGVSPSQGCSYLKVNNGDKIEWSYLGS